MKQTLKYIYERLIETNKIGESKFSITIALASGVIVFAGSFFQSQNIYASILSGGCIVFAFISVLYSFIALFARQIKMSKKSKKNSSKNLMYFKTILHFDEVGYVEEIKRRYLFPKYYKIDEFDLDLSRQIISLAKVVNLKFLYFNLSLIFLIFSVLLGVILILYLGGVLQ